MYRSTKALFAEVWGRRVLTGCACVCLSWGVGDIRVRAQDTAAPAVPAESAQEQPSPTTWATAADSLVLMARAESSLPPDDVKGFIELACQLANEDFADVGFTKEEDSVVVVEISEEKYMIVMSFMEDLGMETLAIDTEEPNTGPIRPAKSDTWILSPGPLHDLEELEVRYEASTGDAATAETEVFKAQGKTSDGPLIERDLGVYVFISPHPGQQIAEYRWKLDDAKDFGEWRKWPQPDRFYAIRVKDYEGPYRALFETLVNRERMGTSLLKDLRLPKATTLMLTDFKQMIPVTGGAWEENRFNVIVNRLPTKNQPTRVWMAFPLSTETKDRVVAELKSLRPGQFKLSKMVHGSVDPALNTRLDPPAAEQPTPLSPPESQEDSIDLKLGPVWYEISPVYSSLPGGQRILDQFERQFEIVDVDKWRRRKDLEEVWRIVLYEFETRTGGEVHRYIIPVQTAADPEPSLWLAQKVLAWPTGYKRVLSESNAAPSGE